MKCPGQDSRLWGPEAIFEAKCPECGGPIEFFKDESSRKCRKCGHKVLNPKMDFGCAAYCRYAAQCLGEDMPPELLAKRTDLLKDRVAAEVKKSLGRDFRRIGRTLKVVDYTGKILRGENVDPAAATLAAYLLALSGPAGTAAPPSNGGGRDASAEARRAAAEILSRTGAPEEVAREVLAILDSMAGGTGLDSSGYRCVSDASRIAEFVEARAKQPAPPEEIARLIDEALLTQSGRDLARQVLTSGEQ
ncbi:MAG: hypothetical protein WAW37_09905 [Syntrophobacteraceae bacterium]